jgi:hypothetical protein
MISLRRLEANRRNALRSTGPRTEAGKERSRANALRHGLTAETVVGTLEDAEDYKAFEAAIIADYEPETAVARELVLRLASLLWRLRRAGAIETNLLELHAKGLGERDSVTLAEEERGARIQSAVRPKEHSDVFQILRNRSMWDSEDKLDDLQHFRAVADYKCATRQLTYSFLRLANLDSRAFERLNRYEAALWRQTVQTLLVLHAIGYR